jgi:uncharacterized protein YdhG (YjbR/CyaY superfamily)
VTDSSTDQAGSIDEYIAQFSGDTREKLVALRAAIRDEAPEAEEAMKYRMPTFVLHGNLVHFAAFKSHIGFFPTASPREAFKEELAPYPGGKGTVQFPLDRPLPLDLVRRIVRFRVEENLQRKKKRS